MNKKIIKLLIQLKENPVIEEVDHILILNELYWIYSEGIKKLKPIAMYFVNGIDDIPALREKNLWGKEKFLELRKPFTDSHSELLIIINNILSENLNK